MTLLQLLMLPTLICGFASLPQPKINKPSIRCWAQKSNEDGDSDKETLSNNSLYGQASSFTSPDAYTESQISKIFGECVPLSLAGRCKTNNNVDMIFLSSLEDGRIISESYIKCLQSDDHDTHEDIDISALPIPLSSSLSSSAIKLLSHSYTSEPLSKSVLLSLNSLLVNRDGGLFDNLPWSSWSVDPDFMERDAANNVVDAKYTMGKRVAYQRFMGKDWQGRSLSLTNLAKKLRYMLERDEESKNDSGSDDTMMLSLSQRLLELEVTEATMFMAECEKNLAIANASESNGEYELEQLEKARARLEQAETSLSELGGATADNQSNAQSLILSILDKLSEQENPPPYRGAIGYPAKLDSKKEMFEDSVLPYSSPYELLNEIISEQLNSEVIGCVLEQCSLLEGNLVVGGSLLLKRKSAERTTTIAGEEVSYSDDDDDYGNEGVLPRSMYLVECFSDEAIGFAMTSRRPILVQREIYERAATQDVELDVTEAMNVRNETRSQESISYLNRMPLIRLFDDIADLTNQVEGDRVLSKSQSRFIRIPLTTNPTLFDGSDQGPQSSAASNTGPVFSTFNPVASLDEFDTLSDDDKVRLLLKLESFKGALPRPRSVANDPSLLDNILLPLIDESVRRQYQIRDAELRGDFEEANALREEISPRQRALEEAQAARDAGFEERALQLEEEAELYKALRADVTQDEGSYSRFLDRDDWYERETKARIKRLDKKKFGTLLDGIDLP